MRCSSLINVILPFSLVRIEDEAFRECHSLKKIVVPKGEITKFRKILDKAIVNSSVIIEENN